MNNETKLDGYTSIDLSTLSQDELETILMQIDSEGIARAIMMRKDFERDMKRHFQDVGEKVAKIKSVIKGKQNE